MIGDPFGYRANSPFSKLINAGGTINLFTTSATAYVYSLLYNCTAAGTTWAVKIVDQATVPVGGNVLYTLNPMVVSTAPVVILNLSAPVPIIGGLSFVTISGTPGSLNVWGNISQN
jgi:hypothetical protein